MNLFRRDAPDAAISASRRRELALFESHAGVRFRRRALLNQALAHRSWAFEQRPNQDHNERLEFLGDSVLGLVVAEELYHALPDRPEGDLARIKSVVVSEQSLAEIARRLKVDAFVLVGKGEENSGGRSKRAILADAMEAVIGAYYLDSGYRAARAFVLEIMRPEIEKVLEDRHHKDYKTLLQELVQKQFRTYPRYTVQRKSGPEHDRTFWVVVGVEGRQWGPAQGKNKKGAEQAAARLAWEDLSGGEE